jgi:hypothetical protein
VSDQSQGSWPQQTPAQPGQVPQQQPYGAPAQQPYGAPAQQPYGAPAYGAPAGYTAPPAQPSNGLSIAALILGILPTGIIGLVVGIIAIVKAKTGAGKAMAWIGTILSVLWIAGSIALFASVGDDVKDNVSRRIDPGCVAVESQASDWQKMGTETDPAAIKADLQKIVDEVKADEAKTKKADVKAALEKFRGDIEELQSAINTGTAPAADLITRMTTDGAAVDTACGR